MRLGLVQKFIFPLQECVKRKPTFRFFHELERSQWLSMDEMRKTQWANLRRQLEYAQRHVPYYRRVFEEAER